MAYWKKLLREAGIDSTNLGAATRDRKAWRKSVKERMAWLDEWEKSQGHHWRGRRTERNNVREEEVEWICEVCKKKCKSKAGLVVHRRRMHEESEKKKKFECEECGENFRQEANMLNHRKLCGGRSSGDRKVCACGREFAKSYIARHRRKCTAAATRAEQERTRLPRVYKGERFVCDCGREMAKSNRARHKREACPYGDAGP